MLLVNSEVVEGNGSIVTPVITGDSSKSQNKVTVDHRIFDENNEDIQSLFTKTILLILNRPIESNELFEKLLQLSDVIVCSDGGANRLLKFCKTQNREVIPDCVIGDFDSITKSSKSQLRQSKGSDKATQLILDQD